MPPMKRFEHQLAEEAGPVFYTFAFPPLDQVRTALLAHCTHGHTNNACEKEELVHVVAALGGLTGRPLAVVS